MALTFKVNGDDTDFKAMLKRMESGVNQTATVISTKMRNAMALQQQQRNSIGGPSGGGHGHGGSRGIGDAINALTGGSGAVRELSAIQGALKTTAIAAVGVYAGVKAFEALADAVKENNAALDAANASAGKLQQTITAGGSSAISQEIEANEKLAEKLKETYNWKAKLVDAFTGGQKGIANLNAQHALEKQNVELQRQGVEQIKQRTEEATDSVSMSEKDVKLLESRHKFDEAIGKSQKEGGVLQYNLARQARAEYEARNKVIEHGANMNEHDMILERNLLEIRRKGSDVEDRSLKEKSRMAQAGMDKSLNPDEYKKFSLEKDRADTELAEKQRERQRKFGEESKTNRIARDRAEDNADNERFRKEAGLRKEISDEQRRAGSEQYKRGLQGEESMAHDLASSLTDQRDKGLARSKLSPRERHAADRETSRMNRAEARYDRAHPGERQAIRDARAREQAARAAQQKMEADLSAESITKLTDAMNKLIPK